MFSKNKSSEKINQDQINLIENAQRRVKQKKLLFFHFSIMFFGIIIMLIINLLFNYLEELIFFNYPWSYLASLIWFIIFLIHSYNVFIANRFMGEEWESKQIQKLVSEQELRI